MHLSRLILVTNGKLSGSIHTILRSGLCVLSLATSFKISKNSKPSKKQIYDKVLISLIPIVNDACPKQKSFGFLREVSWNCTYQGPPLLQRLQCEFHSNHPPAYKRIYFRVIALSYLHVILHSASGSDYPVRASFLW